MKSAAIIERELNDIIQKHYYSEDFELMASIRSYISQLPESDFHLLQEVVVKRLRSDCSMVDMLLCSVVHVPSAVPILAAKLDEQENTNQVTRTLITALSRYPTNEAYLAVERFLDSDQEWETLQALAAIDFRRSLPHIARFIAKTHLHGTVLHLLHDRKKVKGLEGMVDDLTSSSATKTPDFYAFLAQALRSKKNEYNPFCEDEIQRILAALKQG